MDTITLNMVFGLIGLAVGLFLGWLITRLLMSSRLVSEKSANTLLTESLRDKTREIEALQASTSQVRHDLQVANEKFLEISNAHAAAKNSLDHMASLKQTLEDRAEEIQSLNNRVPDLKQRQTELATLMESEKAMAAEKAAMLEELKIRMADSFKALSSRALQENNQSFLDLAGQTFTKYVEAAKHDFDSKEKAVKEFIAPVSTALEKYDQQVQSMEKAREKAYGELSQQVVSLSRTQNELQRETGKLVNALRMPHVRGRWGEITLRRVVELSGMLNRCDFFEQQTPDAAGNSTRPDMIIQLPGDRKIVVDSKVPITAYLDALETEDMDHTEEMLARHAGHVRTHIKQLAAKEYWTQFTPTPEFVVLFMPGENFFSAALQKEPGLIEEAANKGVILATPTTLISLLKAVAYGWKQETAAENAKAVSELGNELYNRMASMVSHFNSLGRDLDKCINTYNKAVGSFERRVLPSARKFEDMGVTIKGGKTIPRLDTVDNKARTMEIEEDDS